MSLPPLVAPAGDLSMDEVRRYSRHLIIPDVGMDGQKRLKNARVLCVGAGGLGSPALMYLAAAGVGTLGIIEFDVVDESNLQRQIIHGHSDVGRSKAKSARESVTEINPFVQVNLHTERLDSSNAMEIFAQYDLIVDGTDNFATRYLVNDACVLLGKLYVWGSIYRFRWSSVGVLGWSTDRATGACTPSLHHRGWCLVRRGRRSRCAVRIDRFHPGDRGHQADHRGRRLTAWTTHGLRRPGDGLPPGDHPQGSELCGVRGHPNGDRANRLRVILWCVTSDSAADPVQDFTISVHDLKAMLDERAAGSRDFVLVDVREPVEWSIVAIDGSEFIPKGEFLTGEAFEKLPQDKQVVLYCRSGGRSAEALVAAKGAGFDAIHVGGGINAWVSEFEPDKPTY